MNKKIICLSVVGMLILFGVSTYASARNLKSVNNENVGDLDVSPNSFNLNVGFNDALGLGNDITLTLTVSNVGSGTLIWQFCSLTSYTDWYCTIDGVRYDDPLDHTALPNLESGESITVNLCSSGGIEFNGFETLTRTIKLNNYRDGAWDLEHVDVVLNKPKSIPADKINVIDVFSNFLMILEKNFQPLQGLF